jgi:hypothetical protein
MQTGKRQRQQERIAEWLGLFMGPGQVTELRALYVPGHGTLSAFFDDEQLRAIAHRAVEWELLNPLGVYFIPNPLRPEMLYADRCANDEDVLCRKWLLVDIDTVRPDHNDPASDDELKASREVMERCRELLRPEGLDNPVVGESGNGWHLCYAVDLPNDEGSQDWCRRLLHWLHDETKTAGGSVDKATHNASRLWKLYGTRSRKGEASSVRPHRWAKIIETE